MTYNPVGWFEIYVQDISRARAFYEAVFKTSLEQLKMPESLQCDDGKPNMEMWAFPMDEEAKGASGALVRMEGAPSGGNTVLVYFSCEDCAVEEGRVAAAGGQVQQTKMPIGEYGFISIVVDTEGNMIGLHSLK